MRLINAATLEMQEFMGDPPPYAILSHTWEEDEVTFQDMQSGAASVKKGYQKIRDTCQQALKNQLQYAWVDTCCIDKTSSAELSEAINSMFRWYRWSAVCYVYFSDLQPSYVPGGLESLNDPSPFLKLLEPEMRQLRWFTRGWTLQELIAPRTILFFSQTWREIGNKTALGPLLSSITGVDERILSDEMPLSDVPAANKMAWAARRQTTRVEDMSYCLMGIFGVFMPLLYGEGMRAFIRLQEEIMKVKVDFSIFAWTRPLDVSPVWQYSGLLAAAPAWFERKHEEWSNLHVDPMHSRAHSEFAVTNRGLRFSVRLLLEPTVTAGSDGMSIILPVAKAYQRNRWLVTLGIHLRMCGADLFVRDTPATLIQIRNQTGKSRYFWKPRPIYAVVEWPSRDFVRRTATFDQIKREERDMRIGHRNGVVRIVLPNGLESSWPRPVSHRDVEDDVFFSTEAFHEGWCTMVMRGHAMLEGKMVPYKFDCLIVCMGWNVGNSTFPVDVIFADLGDTDSRNFEQLLAFLEAENNDHIPWPLRNLHAFGLQPRVGSISWDHGSDRISLDATTIRTRGASPDICPVDKSMWHVNVALRSEQI